MTPKSLPQSENEKRQNDYTVILQKITDFADTAHGQQLRKYSPERYIVHPVRVMETCREYEMELPILAAALLHDVLEDTKVDSHAIRKFLLTVMSETETEQTLELVTELTDVYVKDAYPQWNRDQRKLKEIERLSKVSPDAQTIKYADILDNTREITIKDPAFAPRFLGECLKILELADKGNRVLRNIAMDTVREGLRQTKARKQGR